MKTRCAYRLFCLVPLLLWALVIVTPVHAAVPLPWHKKLNAWRFDDYHLLTGALSHDLPVLFNGQPERAFPGGNAFKQEMPAKAVGEGVGRELVGTGRPVIGGVSWEANEKNYKPDTGYSWDGTNAFYFVGPTLQHLVTNTFQRMSFVARPRAKAIGARPGVTGVVQGGDVDLKVNFGFDDKRDEHSAQFNWNIHRLNGFYAELLRNLIPPP